MWPHVDAVLEEFLERNDLTVVPFDEDGVARVVVDGVGDLSVDFSCEEKVCLHLLIRLEHYVVQFLLRGLWLCDPSRVVGRQMHFVAAGGEDGWSVGFLIVLDKGRANADTLSSALSQLSGAMARLRHG